MGGGGGGVPTSVFLEIILFAIFLYNKTAILVKFKGRCGALSFLSYQEFSYLHRLLNKFVKYKVANLFLKLTKLIINK